MGFSCDPTKRRNPRSQGCGFHWEAYGFRLITGGGMHAPGTQYNADIEPIINDIFVYTLLVDNMRKHVYARGYKQQLIEQFTKHTYKIQT